MSDARPTIARHVAPHSHTRSHSTGGTDTERPPTSTSWPYSTSPRDGDRVVDTIFAGSQWQGVAGSPNGQRVYIANFDNALKQGSLKVATTVNNDITESVPIGKGSWGVTVGPTANAST